MHKKPIAIILLIAMLIVAVSGCVPSTPSAPADQTGGADKTPAQQQEMQKITYYTWESGEVDSPIWDKIREDLNIDVQVKILPDTGGTDKEVAFDIVQMSGGDMDMRHITSSNIAYRYEKGFMLPLNDMLQKKGIDLRSICGSFVDLATINGDIVGVPIRNLSIYYFYNKDIFDKEGVPYPQDGWTWDKFKEIAEKLSKGEGADRQYGYCANIMTTYWAYQALYSGVKWYTEDGYSNIDHPAFVQALRDFREMDEKGIKPSYVSMKSRNSYISVEFLSGKCAIGQCLGYVIRDMRYKDQFPFDFDFGVVFPPVYVDGVSPKSTTASVQVMAINPNSRNPEAALDAAVHYIKEGAEYIAPLSEVPIINPGEEVIEAFMKDTPLSREDAMKFFDPEVERVDVTIRGPASAKYNQIVLEEVEKCLVGEQEVEETIQNIKRRTDEAIDAEKAGS